jgi:hypothetical protein
MTEKNNILGYSLLGLFIGLGVGGGSYFASDAFKQVKLANQTLTVKGVAEKNVKSDYAQWSGNIRFEDTTQQDVYQKLLAQKKEVKTFLLGKGFGAGQIKFGNISIYPRYELTDQGMTTNTIEKYEGNITVSIEGSDIGKITKISDEASELINQGIDFNSYPPQYLYRKLDELKIELLGKAAEDAKERAVELAKSVSNSIGGLKTASQGVFQVTGLNDTSTSDSGVFDTSTVDKKVRSVVTMSFAIE